MHFFGNGAIKGPTLILYLKHEFATQHLVLLSQCKNRLNETMQCAFLPHCCTSTYAIKST